MNDLMEECKQAEIESEMIRKAKKISKLEAREDVEILQAIQNSLAIEEQEKHSEETETIQPKELQIIEIAEV